MRIFSIIFVLFNFSMPSAFSQSQTLSIHNEKLRNCIERQFLSQSSVSPDSGIEEVRTQNDRVDIVTRSLSLASGDFKIECKLVYDRDEYDGVLDYQGCALLVKQNILIQSQFRNHDVEIVQQSEVKAFKMTLEPCFGNYKMAILPDFGDDVSIQKHWESRNLNFMCNADRSECKIQILNEIYR